MQHRLAPPSRLTDWLHRWALRWGFPLLAHIAPRWPRWWLFLHARWIIFLIMAVYPRPKREIARNLERVLGRPRRSLAVRAARRRMLRHFARYWVDLFRFPQLPPERARSLLAAAHGLERMEDLVAEGRGAILLTAHMGNWELGSVLLAQKDVPVHVVYAPDKFAVAERFRSDLRRRAGVVEIPLSPEAAWSSLPVLRALRAGGVVAMQGDRDPDGSGIPALFFGSSVCFPRGPFVTALLTGAPIVPAFVLYDRRARFLVELGSPIRVEADREDREAALEAAVGGWAAVLEEHVRRHPDQWYTFFHYWEDRPGRTPRARSAPADLVGGQETAS